jgi:hypothetical protein
MADQDFSVSSITTAQSITLYLCKTQDSSNTFSKETRNDLHIIKRQVNQAENMCAKSYEEKYRLSPLHL